MPKAKNGVTRRRFLEQVGLAGGAAAMYETMTVAQTQPLSGAHN